MNLLVLKDFFLNLKVFYMQDDAICKHNFTASLMIWLFVLLLLTNFSNTSSIMSTTESEKSGYPCFAPDLRREA